MQICVLSATVDVKHVPYKSNYNNNNEIEGVINTRELCLYILNRCIPFFHEMEIPLKPREQRFIKIDLISIDEISGLAIMKSLNVNTDCANMVR